MSNLEKKRENAVDHGEKDEQLNEIASEREEALRDKLEQEHAKEEKKRVEKEEALKEAAELAEESDKKIAEASEKDSKAPTLRGAPSKKQLRQSFNEQMKDVRSELGPGGRVFSKVIHNPVIESVSDFVSSTIARPNALLAGSISALLGVTIIYMLAKHYGFQLSGFETIGAFVVGWLIGIIYDYTSSIFRSKDK